MGASDLILAAAAGAVCLAMAATFWALAQGRRAGARIAALTARLKTSMREAEAARGAAEAFDGAVLAIEADEVHLVCGEETAAACAELFGARDDPRAVLEALAGADPHLGARLQALVDSGEPFTGQAHRGESVVEIEGRAAGSICWVRLSLRSEAEPGLPSVGLLSDFLDAQAEPVWLARGDGTR